MKHAYPMIGNGDPAIVKNLLKPTIMMFIAASASLAFAQPVTYVHNHSNKVWNLVPVKSNSAVKVSVGVGSCQALGLDYRELKIGETLALNPGETVQINLFDEKIPYSCLRLKFNDYNGSNPANAVAIIRYCVDPRLPRLPPMGHMGLSASIKTSKDDIKLISASIRVVFDHIYLDADCYDSLLGNVVPSDKEFTFMSPRLASEVSARPMLSPVRLPASSELSHRFSSVDSSATSSTTRAFEDQDGPRHFLWEGSDSFVTRSAASTPRFKREHTADTLLARHFTPNDERAMSAAASSASSAARTESILPLPAEEAPDKLAALSTLEVRNESALPRYLVLDPSGPSVLVRSLGLDGKGPLKEVVLDSAAGAACHLIPGHSAITLALANSQLAAPLAFSLGVDPSGRDAGGTAYRWELSAPALPEGAAAGPLVREVAKDADPLASKGALSVAQDQAGQLTLPAEAWEALLNDADSAPAAAAAAEALRGDGVAN